MGDDMRCQLQPDQASQSELLFEPQVRLPLMPSRKGLPVIMFTSKLRFIGYSWTLLLCCRFNLGSREVEAEGGKILRATDPDYNFGATVANEKVCFLRSCRCMLRRLVF